MEDFENIYQRARARARAIANTSNDRYLSEMTRCVFQAGFVWRVANQKLDNFEDGTSALIRALNLADF